MNKRGCYFIPNVFNYFCADTIEVKAAFGFHVVYNINEFPLGDLIKVHFRRRGKFIGR